MGGEAVMDEEFYNHISEDRISSRQIDELIGIARGLAADEQINLAEAEFLQKWLAANIAINNHPLIKRLYQRVTEMLMDGALDDDEKSELLSALDNFSSRTFELGEPLKASTLPVCDPAPDLSFTDMRYCFTGTFLHGQRKDCEAEIFKRGGTAGSLTQKTNILVIGAYATESWKHSSFGKKILQAVEWREKKLPISIVSEEHWTKYL